MSDIYNGEEVVIRGTITRSSGSSKTFDVRDHINPETTEVASQAGQSVVQSIVSQASSMGMSGCIAMGSGVYFQADAVTDNWTEAIEVATPMVNELIETGTIQETLPADSKYNYVDIPTTTSFLGMKVGKERQMQKAYEALTPEEKEARDVIKQSVQTPDARAEEREASSI